MPDPWLDIDLPEGALAFLAPGAGAVPAEKLKKIAKSGKLLRGGAVGVGVAIGTYLLLDHLYPDGLTGYPWKGPGWTLCCRRSTNPAGSGSFAIKNLGGSACSGFNCNHPGSVLLLSTTHSPVSTRSYFVVKTSSVPDGTGWVIEEWARPTAAKVWPHSGRLFRGHGTPASLSEALADPGNALNPNVARAAPGLAQAGNPVLSPADAPFVDPAPDLVEDDLGQPLKSPAIRITVTPGVGTPTAPGTGTETGTPPAPSPSPTPGAAPAPGAGGGGSVVVTHPTHPRQPPTKKTKERKVKSRGLRLFDIISEAGDAVDCFYKALPKNVQKKWDKKQTGTSKKYENVGQYGFGGADYKTPALYHNWDKVDLQKAMQCLVYNQLEDAVIGKIASLKIGGGFAGNTIVREFFRNEGGKLLAKSQKKWDEFVDFVNSLE